jgi:hypothetical protein
LAGSQEVNGSIPFISTKKIKDLREIVSPFFVQNWDNFAGDKLVGIVKYHKPYNYADTGLSLAKLHNKTDLNLILKQVFC